MSCPREAVPFGLSLGSVLLATRYRLFAPQSMTNLVREQDHAGAIDFILRLGRPYFMTAHQAESTPAPVRFVGTDDDGRKAPLR